MLSQIRNQNHQGAQKGPSQIKNFISSSSTLAWKIPWIEEPGRLQSMDGVAKSLTQLSDFTFTFTKQLHDYKESWAPKSCCFWTVVLHKTLESPLDCKEIQPVHLENQSWKFTGRTDDEAETPIILATRCEELNHLKRPWCWERLKVEGEGTTDDEMVGWLASLTQWTWVWVTSGSWWWTREAWCAAVHGATKSRTQLSNWTELKQLQNTYLIL